MIEMMAQTGGMLLGAFDDYTTDVIFAKIENAQFSSDWQAGEPIEISATSENLRTEGAWIDGEIKNESGCVAKARLLLMNAGKLNAAGDSSTTFHPAFMNHFKIREKVR